MTIYRSRKLYHRNLCVDLLKKIFLSAPLVYLLWQYYKPEYSFRDSLTMEAVWMVMGVLWAWVSSYPRGENSNKEDPRGEVLSRFNMREWISLQWWRMTLLLSFLPGTVYILVCRVREMSGNISGFASPENNIVIFFTAVSASLLFFNAVYYRGEVIQGREGLYYGIFFIPWQTIKKIQISDQSVFLYIRTKVNIPQVVFPVRSVSLFNQFLKNLKNNGLFPEEKKPAALLPGSISIFFSAFMFLLAIYLQNFRAGHWFWKILILIMLSAGVKFFEERFTGFTRLSRKKLKKNG